MATPTNVYLRFERLPSPDTEPSYNTASVLIDSTTVKESTIEIPSQGANTFESFPLYVVKRDRPVLVSNVVVTGRGIAKEPKRRPLAASFTFFFTSAIKGFDLRFLNKHSQLTKIRGGMTQ